MNEIYVGEALTRAEMDHAHCNSEDCEHGEHEEQLQLMIICPEHMRDGLVAVYDKPTGQLRIWCHACHEPLINLQIAQGLIQ